MRTEPSEPVTVTEIRAPHHPREETLLRFLKGETSGAETREVVRHLLAGCRQCVAVTKPVWELTAEASRPKSRRRGDEVMARAVQEAREGLRRAARDLQDVFNRLAGIHAALPASPRETSQEDLGPEADVLTEMRAVIRCVSRDCLGPALRDLLAAVAFRSSSPPVARGGRMPPGLDLGTESEETRKALYDIVVQDNFGPPAADEPAESQWRPPYTPEAAGLRMFFEHGRWFATWLKLEEPAELPEAERRELLVLAEDPEEPGRLIYREV